MNRTKPMKRSGFRKPERHEREPQPFATLPESLRRAARMGPVVLKARPKNPPVEHEGYRRLVAAMPCAWCSIEGYSQAAHANEGKGMGIKTDDRTCFPLCGPRPSVRSIDPGCHRLFDEGAVLSRDAARLMAMNWGRQTRADIRARGLWPKDLPAWPEDSIN